MTHKIPDPGEKEVPFLVGITKQGPGCAPIQVPVEAETRVKVIVVKRWFPGNTSFKTTAEMVIEMNERLMELSLLPKNIIGFAIDSDGCWVLMYYDAIGSVTKSSDYDDSEPPFTVDPNFFEHLLNCMDNQKFIQSYPTEEIQERMKAALEEGGNSEMTEEALEDWSGGMSREEAQKVIDEANQTARHLLNNHILQHKGENNEEV